MRKVSQHEYETAKAFLAAYADYCKPYVQKNGWTVIPANAPRFVYEGRTAYEGEVNDHSTNVELFEFERDMPEKFCAYAVIDNERSRITTWKGEVVARVTHEGKWHRNNFGGKWRQLTIRTDWNQTYTGREYDSCQLVNFRRVACK